MEIKSLLEIKMTPTTFNRLRQVLESRMDILAFAKAVVTDEGTGSPPPEYKKRYGGCTRWIALRYDNRKTDAVFGWWCTDEEYVQLCKAYDKETLVGKTVTVVMADGEVMGIC